MTIIPNLNALGVAVNAAKVATIGDAQSLQALAVAFNQLSPEVAAHIAHTHGLNEALLNEVFRQEQANAETAEAIMQHYNAATSKKVEAGATDNLSNANRRLGDTFTGLGAVMKNHPIMTIITVLSFAIPLISTFVSSVHDTTEELKTQLDSTDSTIAELNAELETTVSRIDELSSKETLSLVEQEELERLKKQNEYLQTRNELLAQQRKEEAKKLNEKVKRDYRGAFQMTGAHEGYDAYIGADNLTEEQYFKRQIKRYQELLDMQDTYSQMSDGQRAIYDEELASTKAYLTDTAGRFAEFASQLEVVDDESQALYDRWMGFATIGKNAAEGNFWSAQLTEQVTDEMSTAAEQLIDLAAQMAEFEQGNVKLTMRPEVEIDGGYETVFSGWADEILGDQTYAIHYTPILGDGTVLSDEELQQELDRLFAGAVDGSDILEQDKVENGGKGIILRVQAKADEQSFDDFFASENDWGQQLHLAQERYYDLIRAIRDNPEFVTLINSMKDLGIVSDDAAGTLLSVAQSITDVGDASNRAAAAVTDLTDDIAKFQTAKDKITKIQELLDTLDDMDELDIGFLSDLYEAVPEVAGEVSTLSEAYTALQGALDDTKEEAEIAYGAMLVANENWLTRVLNDSSTLPVAMAGYYKQDLSNWKDLATAKWKVDSMLVNDLSTLWAKYLSVSNAELQRSIDLFEDGYTLGYTMTDAERKTYKEMRVVLGLRKELEVDFSKIGTGTTSTSSSSKVEAYVVELNKLYDTERRLADLQKDYDLIDAKRALLDEDDIDGQAEAVADLTALLNDQNAVLNEQNNIRRQIIQDEIARLEELGFDIDYDPLANELNIKNWQRLTELQATSVGEYDSLQEATNELKKDTEEALEKLMEYNEANVDNSLQWWKNLKTINDLLDEIQDSMQSVRDEQKEQLEAVLDLVIEMIRQEKEDEKEAIEDNLDAYRKIVETRKEMLQLMQREKSYTDSIAEKTAKLAKIEQKLAALKLDDSREARLEEAALLEERAELSKELADEQSEHYVSSTEDALDKELEAYEDQKDKELKALDEFLDDQQRLTQEALSRLDNMNESLFVSLQSYVLKYTETSSAEFQSMWDDAMAAAKEYGSFTEALAKTSVEVSRADAVDATASSIVSQMKANGAAWHNTSGQAQADLVSQNESLANQLQGLFDQSGVSATITKTNGVWYINGEKLFDKYHTGTASVGTTPTARQSETLALLENREMVLTQKHQDALWQMLQTWAPLNSLNERLPNFSGVTAPSMTQMGHTIKVEAPIYMTGNLTDETLRVLKEHSYTVASLVSKQLNKL